MTRDFNELYKKLSPERRANIDKRVQEAIDKMPPRNKQDVVKKLIIRKEPQ